MTQRISDLPDELEMLKSNDTEADRLAACGVPQPWSWATTPPGEATKIAEHVREWLLDVEPLVYGILLHGPSGLGKTGIAIAAVRDAALARVGSNAAWMIATHPRVVADVASGNFRPRPAPAQFYRWTTLKARLDAAVMGRAGFVEEPPLDADKILREIEERCAVIALDDIDVGAETPWKEEILLRLLELPARRQARMLITCNYPPRSDAGLARLGERIADRLLDSRVFGQLRFTGGDGETLRD